MITCEINEEVGLTENTYYFDANGRLDNEPTDGKCIKIVTNVRDSETGKVLVKWWNTLDGTPPFRCKFLEYDVDSEAYLPDKPDKPITKDHYVITWNGNGGTPNTQQTAVVVGSALVAIPSVVNSDTDVEFSGWYDDEYAGNQITTSTVPSDDSMYYARWQSTKINITYIFDHRDDNGDDLANQIIQIRRNESINVLPTYNFTNTTYKDVLIGWQSDNEPSNEFKPVSLPYTPTKDEVFRAIWSSGYLELKITKVYNSKRYVCPVFHRYNAVTNEVYCNQNGEVDSNSRILNNYRTTDLLSDYINTPELLFDKNYKVCVSGKYQNWVIDMSTLPIDSDTMFYYNEYEQIDSSKIKSYLPHFDITWKFSHATPSTIVTSVPETDTLDMPRPTHKLTYNNGYGIYGWDKSSNEMHQELRDYYAKQDETINSLWFTGSITLIIDMSNQKISVTGGANHYLHVVFTKADNSTFSYIYFDSNSSNSTSDDNLISGVRITSFSWGDYGTGKDINIALPSSGKLTITFNADATYSVS